MGITLASVMAPPTSNVTTSPLTAACTVARSEPGPASFRFVTCSVAACVVAPAVSSARVAARRRRRRADDDKAIGMNMSMKYEGVIA